MQAIWKFPVDVADRFVSDMPDGATILSVQYQHGSIQMWALVDPSKPVVQRKFSVYGTGHPIEPGGTFIGTFQIHEGALVFHLFDYGSGT